MSGVVTVAAHDELQHGGESLVLVEGQVRRVSLIGTAIRILAADGIAVEDLARALGEQFGAPPEGDLEELTRHAVADLLGAGLLAGWPR